MTAIETSRAGAARAQGAPGLAEAFEPDAFDMDPLDPAYAEAEALDPDVVGSGVTDPGLAEPGTSRPTHLRVAPRISREVLRRRRLARLAVFGVAALSAASMFTLVAFHVFAAQSAFQLDKLDNQLSAEQRDYGHLRDQVATLSSPQAVTSAAARDGMVRSSNVILLHAATSAPYGSNVSLPIPPSTPYPALADPGP